MGDADRHPRATRYALECGLRFRSADAGTWSDGTLKNISESGLLFEPSVPVDEHAHLEIAIDLPPPGIGSIWCTAVVVRAEPRTHAIGARITEYRLQPRST